jgi:hypothetical protein
MIERSAAIDEALAPVYLQLAASAPGSSAVGLEQRLHARRSAIESKRLTDVANQLRRS